VAEQAEGRPGLTLERLQAERADERRVDRPVGVDAGLRQKQGVTVLPDGLFAFQKRQFWYIL
jgi:hypothetical protein